jgi:hypothetical protein
VGAENSIGSLTWAFVTRPRGREDAVVLVLYELFGRIVELLVLRGRRDRSKDVEILVLRKHSKSCNGKYRDHGSNRATGPCSRD